MPRMKLSYQQSNAKRAVQQDIFSAMHGKFDHVVGLAGPNIDYYLHLVKKANIQKATIYENNLTQLFIQLQKHTTVLPAKVLFKDILQAQAGLDNTVYDLDFCFSILKAYDPIKKFAKDSTITTVSVRPMGVEDTQSLYCKAAFNTVKFKTEHLKNTQYYEKRYLHTKNGSVLCYQYFDTSSMLVFSNIK